MCNGGEKDDIQLRGLELWGSLERATNGRRDNGGESTNFSKVKRKMDGKIF